jgi:hypothetical protein
MKDQEKKIDSLIDKVLHKDDEPLTDEKMCRFAGNANRVQQLTYYLLTS